MHSGGRGRRVISEKTRERERERERESLDFSVCLSVSAHTRSFPNMAPPFLCLPDSCCSAMTRSSPLSASLGQQEKPDVTSWLLAGRANPAKPRRETRKAMATSSHISVLFAVQKSTSLRPSKSGKVWPWERERDAHYLPWRSHMTKLWNQKWNLCM